ncbi:MAG TPA: TolC family protein [Candidatus Acidoferrales bacterium]|nr:TolC family protein [Candidatus Acidoferrales bacterium]
MNKIKINAFSLAATQTVILTTICSVLLAAPALAQQAQPPLKLQTQAGTAIHAATAAQTTAQQSAAGSQAEPGILTLDQVVNLALEHSPDLALARVRYTVAQKITGVDRAEFRPNLYTGSGAAYTNGFPQTPGGGPPAVFEMSYTQALFDPVKRGQLRADEDLAKNQELEYQNMRDTVMVRAASAYLELADVRHSLELLRGERESEQKILDVTRQRATAGLELPVALTEDELELAKTAQRVVQYESRDEILSDQIRDMAGLPPDQPIEVSSDEVLASQAAEPASNVVTDALDHSRAIREAENERTAREHILKGAKGAYWPTISLVGQYSVLSKFNNYALFFNHFQRNNVNAGVQITIPIFSAHTSAAAALAHSQLNEADLELSSAKRTVRIGAEQKVRTLREMDAGTNVAQLDLRLAQEQLQDAQVKFNQGRATLRDLEQARVLENEKWLAFLDANLSREKAQLDLLQATGQLTQMFH